MGQEGCAIEWSLQSQKQWGVSPDALIPGRPLKEGLDQRRPSWLAIHTQVPPRGPRVIILPSVSFNGAGNKMFTPFLTFFSYPPRPSSITSANHSHVYFSSAEKSTGFCTRLHWVRCDFLQQKRKAADCDSFGSLVRLQLQQLSSSSSSSTTSSSSSLPPLFAVKRPPHERVWCKNTKLILLFQSSLTPDVTVLHSKRISLQPCLSQIGWLLI